MHDGETRVAHEWGYEVEPVKALTNTLLTGYRKNNSNRELEYSSNVLSGKFKLLRRKGYVLW